MKKLSKFCIYIFFILLFNVNVRCEEIQLTDYMYTAHRDMLDGYSYVEFAGGNNIIKPDGTYLYDSTKYYAIYPDTYHTFDGGISEFYQKFYYPQFKCGNKFLVYSKSDDKAGVINDKGEFDIPCSYERIYDVGEYYYGFVNKGIFGIIDKKTGEQIFSDICQLYVSLDKEKIACVKYTNEDENIAAVYFYDKGKLYDSSQNIKLPEKIDHSILYTDDVISDKYGENLYGCDLATLHFKEEITDGGEIRGVWYYDFLKAETERLDNGAHSCIYIIKGSGSDRVDPSLYFKSKEIQGVTYYALYTNTPENQKDKYSLTLPVTISDKYKENIQKAYDKDLLKNSFMCCYDNGITRGEMAFILSKMYCKLKGSEYYLFIQNADIRKELSDKKKAYDTFIYKMCCMLTGISHNEYMEETLFREYFDDTKDIYCRFAYTYGLMDSDPILFQPDKIMTEDEVSECLNKAAHKFGINSIWQNAKGNSSEYGKEICSRAQAYSQIYKFYNLCKKTSVKTFSSIYAILGLLAVFLIIMYIKNSKLTNRQF